MSSGQSIQAPTPAPVQPAPSPSIEQLPGAEPLPSDRPPVQSARFASSQASTGTSLQPQASPEGGSEELAIAKTYLNGVSGHQVDSAQAAEWLWKATAKQNSEAPLLLSDLYLKGQGVEKNCDQAQVLLAAAARKGTKDAAERLRHLPAFGCQ